jgi:hypothetical protein
MAGGSGSTLLERRFSAERQVPSVKVGARKHRQIPKAGQTRGQGRRKTRAPRAKKAVKVERRTPGGAARTTRRSSGIRHSSPLSMLWSARIVALLFGMGLSLAVPAYTRIFRSIFGPGPTVGSSGIAVFFVCGAVGPWAARRAAMWLVRTWTQTVRGAFPQRPGFVSARIASEGGDLDGLAWLLQSRLGALLGVLMLASLACTAAVRHVWAGMSGQLFWTPATEAVCHCLFITAVVGPTGVAAGLQLAALYSAVSRRHGDAARAPHGPGREARVTASLLAGIAVGLAVQGLAGTPGLSAERWVLLSAVLMFGISVISAWVARGIDRLAGEASTADHRRPGTTAEWPVAGESRGLILSSVTAWGISTGLWSSVLWCDGGEFGAGPAPGGMAWMLGAMAVGAWVSGWPLGRRRYSMGGFGMALWAAGSAIMIAIASAAAGNGHRWMVFGRMPAALATAVCFGYALPYGRRAFVDRLSGDRQGLVRWAAATVGGLVAGTVAYHWFRTGISPGIVAMAAACLLLLITGGLLLIHEHASTRHVRRRRLGTVFASLALAVLVLPSAAKRAPGSPADRVQTGEPRETGTGTGTAAPGRAQPLARDRARWAEMLCSEFGWAGPGARIGSVGDTLFTVTPDVWRDVWRIDQVFWNSEAAAVGAPGLENTITSLSGPPRVYGSADTWWRRERSRYDFIVQTADGLPPDDVPARSSWEWFEGLRKKLLPKGALLVELPLAPLNMAAVESVAQTFGGVFESYDRWLIAVGTGADLRAYLFATAAANGPTEAVSTTRRQLSTGVWASFRRLPLTDDDRQPIPLNTLRAPAFRASREADDGGAAVLRSLRLDMPATGRRSPGDGP